MSGYVLHPAIADAALHLSAAAIKPRQAGKAVRVPASLGALQVRLWLFSSMECTHVLQRTLLSPGCLCRGHSTLILNCNFVQMHRLQASAVHPLALPSPESPDGTVLCKYSLHQHGGVRLQLADLVAKEMRALPAMHKVDGIVSQTAEEVAATAEFLYETQWQAAQPERDTTVMADVMSPAAELAIGPRTLLSHKQPRYMLAAPGRPAFPTLPPRSTILVSAAASAASTDPASAALRFMQLWQGASSAVSHGRLLLATQGATLADLGAHDKTALVGGSAVAVVLRVAAMEAQDTAFGIADASDMSVADSREVVAHAAQVRMLCLCCSRYAVREHAFADRYWESPISM